MVISKLFNRVRESIGSGRPIHRTKSIYLKRTRLKVRISDTFRKRAIGLSNHKGLLENEGMLFVFDREGRHGFWMYGMKFSIDIIWLDGSMRVIYVWRDAEPCRSLLECRTVRPNKNAKYVVELRAGSAKKLGIKIGDRLKL